MTKSEQEAIELEMAYEPYSSQTSCLNDEVVSPGGDYRACRRGKGHTGPHASGFGAGFMSWEKTSEDFQKDVYTQCFEGYN